MNQDCETNKNRRQQTAWGLSNFKKVHSGHFGWHNCTLEGHSCLATCPEFLGHFTHSEQWALTLRVQMWLVTEACEMINTTTITFSHRTNQGLISVELLLPCFFMWQTPRSFLQGRRRWSLWVLHKDDQDHWCCLQCLQQRAGPNHDLGEELHCPAWRPPYRRWYEAHYAHVL